jgi:hypothetical protein
LLALQASQTSLPGNVPFLLPAAATAVTMAHLGGAFARVSVATQLQQFPALVRLTYPKAAAERQRECQQYAKAHEGWVFRPAIGGANHISLNKMFVASS